MGVDEGNLQVIDVEVIIEKLSNSIPLTPLCYIAGTLKKVKGFRTNPPVPGARAVSFIDDITEFLPPELSLDMAV